MDVKVGKEIDLSDSFNGDDQLLFECAESLLSLDASGKLAPHGIGGHAFKIIESLVVRLKAKSNQSELEIVQKALELTGLDMLCNGSSYVVADHCSSDEVSTDGNYFNNTAELLTWAKQTIGE